MYVKIGEYPEGDEEREIEVVIDRYDTWNMDDTLAHIILPMLKQLKENKHGAPWVDVDDVPKSLRPSDKEVDEYYFGGMTDPNFFRRWDYVMGEMIFAFESKFNEWEDKYHTYTPGEINLEFEPEGPAQLRLFPDEDGNTEDYEYYSLKSSNNRSFDREGYQQEADRIQNGFRLFGKYYQSLWD